MSNAALQRTIRRTGAVVVFAIGVLTMALVEWLTAQGILLDFRAVFVPLLFLGPLVSLVVSFLAGAAEVFESGVSGESADGEAGAADGVE